MYDHEVPALQEHEYDRHEVLIRVLDDHGHDFLNRQHGCEDVYVHEHVRGYVYVHARVHGLYLHENADENAYVYVHEYGHVCVHALLSSLNLLFFILCLIQL